MSTLIEKRSFHWFRFSLRTLMLAIGAIALWLGHYIGWMHERHAMLETVESHPIEYTVLKNGVQQIEEESPRGPFPWPLRLLGERLHTLIVVPGQRSNRQNVAVAQHACRLFPEACVQFADDELFRAFDDDCNELTGEALTAAIQAEESPSSAVAVKLTAPAN